VPLDFVEQPPAQIVRLEQVAEAAHRGLVRHRLAVEYLTWTSAIPSSAARLTNQSCGKDSRHGAKHADHLS
jgi:hypothetical protein